MVRLALPGMIMVEAEFFAFEILTLASGQFGTSALAAQSTLVTIASTFFFIPFPMAIASSTRVANLIGAKVTDAAKTSAKVVSQKALYLRISHIVEFATLLTNESPQAFVGGCIIASCNLIILSSLRYRLPLLFTDDEEVIEMVATTVPILAAMQIFDGLTAVSQGLLRGIGWQEFGGYVNLAAYYLVALPISFGTAFGLGWELKGLWTGVTVGLFL